MSIFHSACMESTIPYASVLLGYTFRYLHLISLAWLKAMFLFYFDQLYELLAVVTYPRGPSHRNLWCEHISTKIFCTGHTNLFTQFFALFSISRPFFVSVTSVWRTICVMNTMIGLNCTARVLYKSRFVAAAGILNEKLYCNLRL